jgi:hypothetical protein
MSEKNSSDSLQHIQFEGCDVCVIAPEDYDALVAALDSIERYGLDTMSGPMETPPDLAAWYRDGVREMVHRARAALKSSRGDL